MPALVSYIKINVKTRFIIFCGEAAAFTLNITLLFQHVSTAANVVSVVLPTPRIDKPSRRQTIYRSQNTNHKKFKPFS